VIELPVEPATMASSASAPSPETPGLMRSARNLRLLVLDDEPAILEFVRACLAGANEVVTVRDVSEAHRHLEKGRFDLVLSDMKGPEFDGRELYHHIVRSRADLERRLVFMTGDVLSEETREFLEQFDLPHLEKPFGRRDLLKAVMQVVNKA
jgi:CheY-like chemotaxis protein